MNLKKITFQLIFILMSIPLVYAQVNLSGKVVDSSQTPMSYANLIAQPQDSLQEIKFAITKADGTYRLDLNRIPYTVTVTFMGYQPKTFEINLLKNENRNIVLSPAAEHLEEVVLEMPVVVKVDTTIYNVEKFITGEERKLKDLLKKLPGVEVDREGNVLINGKKVETLLVEGKKFFGGGTKLGVENIPADAVDQVVALDNYNEIPFLKDLDNSNEMALNIKLKEGKKNFVFGSLEAAKGNRNYYSAASNLYYYSKTTTINALGNLNNTRKQVFTYEQYNSFVNSLNSVFLGGATVFSDDNSDLSQFIENKDVVRSKRQFGALNLYQDIDSKTSISGYVIFSGTDESTRDKATNIYNSFTENRDINSTQDNFLTLGNLEISYLPNLTDRWYSKTQFKHKLTNNVQGINTRIDTITNQLSNRVNNSDNTFNQVLEWHRKFNKRHNLSFGATYSFNTSEPYTTRISEQLIFDEILPIRNEESIDLKQTQNRESHEFKAILKHYWVLDKNNHFYTTLGSTYRKSKFQSIDFQELENGSKISFADQGFNNDLLFNLKDFYFGIFYKFKTGPLTLGQGIYIHYYDWELDQTPYIKENKVIVLPQVSATWDFNRSDNVTFKYDLRSSFADERKFASGSLIQSYNTLFRGNSTLENSLWHEANLRIVKSSNKFSWNYYVTAFYKEELHGIQNKVRIFKSGQELMPVYLRRPYKDFNSYGRISNRFEKLKYYAGIGVNSKKYKQPLDGMNVENLNRNLFVQVGGETLFKDLPTLEFSFKQYWGDFELNGNTSSYSLSRPSILLNYDFLKGFIAAIDYEASFYTNRKFNVNTNYALANVSLFYEFKKSGWNFELEISNLFDVEFKNRNSFSNYLISESQSYIMPRILLFKIGYRL